MKTFVSRVAVVCMSFLFAGGSFAATPAAREQVKRDLTPSQQCAQGVGPPVGTGKCADRATDSLPKKMRKAGDFADSVGDKKGHAKL